MRTVPNADALKTVVPLRAGDALRKPRIALPEQVAEPEALHEPVPVTPTINVDVDLEGLSQSNTALADTIIKVLEAQKPATPAEPATKVTEWQFDFQRNDQGFLKGMTAKAKG